MNNIFIDFFPGFMSGFFLFIIFHYIPSKKYNIKMELDLFIKSNCFHIHHWISTLIIIIFMFIGRYIAIYYFKFIIGLLVGILVEDFLFRNVFKLYNCNRR